MSQWRGKCGLAELGASCLRQLAGMPAPHLGNRGVNRYCPQFLHR